MSLLVSKALSSKGRMIHTFEVDSVQDLNDTTVNPEQCAYYNREMLNTNRDRFWYNRGIRRGIDGIEKIDAADPMFYNEVAQKLKMLTAPISEKATAREVKRKRKRIRGDYGNSLDIHEVRQGRIDRAWERTKFIEKEVHGAKLVHIVVNASLNASISAEQAEWRSAAIIAIHDALVKMNKSVSISVTRVSVNCFTTIPREDMCMFHVPVKAAGQYMSAEHLSAYTSATFVRTMLMFKFSNSIPGLRPTSNYGFAVEARGALPRPLQDLKNKGQHVVMLGHCFSHAAAEDAIEKVVSAVRYIDAHPSEKSKVITV